MLHQLVYQLIPFPLQVCECPSQVTSVHNLTDQALKIVLNAVSVVDFGHVRPRKGAIPHCWMVNPWRMEDGMDGMVILTPLWCWTFPKDGGLVVL